MKVAVVGHIEWVHFARVAQLPRPGEIIHAPHHWEEPAGGGAMAAVELARRAGSCDLFTSLGDDDLARRARERLSALGVRVHAVPRASPTTEAFTLVDDSAERTIGVLGEKLRPHGDDALPWELLAAADAVYFASGDAEALRQARRAKVLVTTARSLAQLREARLRLDALVFSQNDPGEAYRDGELEPPPRLVVATNGAAGGRYWTATGTVGDYQADSLSGPAIDVYGAGDSFAAGLTWALGAGRPLVEALQAAARSGASALRRRGAHGQ